MGARRSLPWKKANVCGPAAHLSCDVGRGYHAPASATGRQVACARNCVAAGNLIEAELLLCSCGPPRGSEAPAPALFWLCSAIAPVDRGQQAEGGIVSLCHQIGFYGLGL